MLIGCVFHCMGFVVKSPCTVSYMAWFQRQVTLQEFRIGSLEYELVEDNHHREIEIHIPSDANMKRDALWQSVKDFLDFVKVYFPEWDSVRMTTETWMIMPELRTRR